MSSQTYSEPCYLSHNSSIKAPGPEGCGDYAFSQNSNNVCEYCTMYPNNPFDPFNRSQQTQQEQSYIMCPNVYDTSNAEANCIVAPNQICMQHDNCEPLCTATEPNLNKSASNMSSSLRPRQNKCVKHGKRSRLRSVLMPSEIDLLPAIPRERDPCSTDKTLDLSSSQYSAFLPTINETFGKIVDRHIELIPKTARLNNLALPRTLKPKVVEEKPKKMSIKVKSPRPSQEADSTRLDQLAYPRLRALTELQNEEAYKAFSDSKKETVNCSLRKSMFSLYSKLSGAKPLQESSTVKKIWTKEEWTEFNEKLSQLAKPKYVCDDVKSEASQKFNLPKKTSGTSIRYSSSSSSFQSKTSSPTSERLNFLSKPKQSMEKAKSEWTLTDTLRNYSPSNRVIQLAQPKRFEDFNGIKGITSSALRYKASQRILELAEPRKNIWEGNKHEMYIVSSNALRAKASPRTLELATPRNTSDNSLKKNPFSVKKKALRAKASARIRALAKPKAYVYDFYETY